jgi:hypothetical protein
MAYSDEIEINFINRNRDGILKNSDGSLLTILPEPDFNFPKIIGVYNYWALDFSSGLVVSGTMDEKSFSKFEVDNDSIGIIQDGKPHNRNIGLGAFVHVSRIFSPDFRFGFEIGASVNANNELNGQYMGGVSLGIKIKKAIVYINSGVSLSGSDVLKDKYAYYFSSATHEVHFKKTFVDEEFTEKRIKPGFYFGISFNLLTATISNGNRRGN